MSSRPLFFLFVDGLGLGPDASANLMSTRALPGFRAWTGGAPWTLQGTRTPENRDGTRVFRGIDATLGVSGLPQSGTGQSTLFTGTNCAALMGRHYGPWPPTVTHPLLDSESLFHRAMELAAGDVLFANAYPDAFFERNGRTGRWSTTTRAARAAGLSLCSLRDLAAGRALAADITGRGLSAFSGAPHPVTEQLAAERLAGLVAAHSLVVFEYFHTDKAGHTASRERLIPVLDSFDEFLLALYQVWPERATLVVTSDHGNAEDIAVKTHTRNPVPLLVYGPLAHHFEGVESLTGVMPAMLQAIEDATNRDQSRGLSSLSRRSAL